jgi:hypothetical protein
MQYDRHIQRYQGVYLADYGGQCVANPAHYDLDNSKPIAYANACDWFRHPSLTGAFDFVANDPNNVNQVPQRGQTIMWNSSLPGGGGAGHIAIFDRVSGPGAFVSLDANWGGKEVHFVTHNWGYVLGWMVPKQVTPQGGDMPTLTTQADLDFLYASMLGRPRGAGEGENVYLNKDYKFVATDLYNSKEAQTRRAQQVQELDGLRDNLNQLNQTVTSLTADDDADKAKIQDELNQIAQLTADLSTAQDKIRDLQDTSVTPPTEEGQSLWDVIKGFLSQFKRKG